MFTDSSQFVYYYKYVYPFTADKSVITTLSTLKDNIYIGTAGGTIIILSGVTMEPLRLLRGYHNEVVSILPIAHPVNVKNVSRVLSKKPSVTRSISPDLVSSMVISNENETAINADRNIILSFGRGYHSVIGDSTNHPCHFNSPLITSCGDNLKNRQPRSNPDFGSVLYWSNEDVKINVSSDSNGRHIDRSSKYSVFSCKTIQETSETSSTATSSH